MPNNDIQEGPARRDDLINLVTAPVLSQVNLNGAEILKMLAELQESVEMISRQIARQIPKGE